jgi:hypothetical protein
MVQSRVPLSTHCSSAGENAVLIRWFQAWNAIVPRLDRFGGSRFPSRVRSSHAGLRRKWRGLAALVDANLHALGRRSLFSMVAYRQEQKNVIGPISTPGEIDGLSSLVPPPIAAAALIAASVSSMRDSSGLIPDRLPPASSRWLQRADNDVMHLSLHRVAPLSRVGDLLLVRSLFDRYHGSKQADDRPSIRTRGGLPSMQAVAMPALFPDRTGKASVRTLRGYRFD